MKEKVIKREKGCYLKLPEEFREIEEIEFFPLKEGYYLLSVPLGNKEAGKPKSAPAPPKPPESVEVRVLKKLDSLGLAKRCPSYLKKVLSRNEQLMLEKLVKQGRVAYIHNKKFQEGIYVIENKKKYPEKSGPSNTLANALFANGYVILDGNKDAQALSERLLKQKGSILGVRGFDGRYYVVTANYFQKVSNALAKLGEEVTPDEVAAKFGFSIDGCKAVLKLLSEKGDYLEKKGDLYIRV